MWAERLAKALSNYRLVVCAPNIFDHFSHFSPAHTDTLQKLCNFAAAEVHWVMYITL